MNDTVMLVSRGQAGATGNIYSGLLEFEDMAFVLHFHRPGDLFVDVGANVGVYTLLAASTGAYVDAFEPLPATFEHLRTNVALNDFGDAVRMHREAVGATTGVLRMTTDRDTTNHVVSHLTKEGEATTEVPIATLDQRFVERTPTFVKIDVEGFELPVLQGAMKTLADQRVEGVLLELNGSGQRFGHSDADVHEVMLSLGFWCYRYDPFARSIQKLVEPNRSGNTLYLRSPSRVLSRIASAEVFHTSAGPV